MTSPYVTVFEITRRVPDWWFACLGLIPLAAGIVTTWGKRRHKWNHPHWLLAIGWSVFGVLCLVVAGTVIIADDLATFTAYQKGDYKTVEDSVTNFHPMPYQGHQDECFSVRDQRFCYSDYEITPGFHNATSHGGPIREGLPVRIAYRKEQILRLEIPQNQAPAPSKQ